MIIEVAVTVAVVSVFACVRWWWKRRNAQRQHQIVKILYSINGGAYSPVAAEEAGNEYV